MLYIQRCNAISHKVEKEGKPHGKNPPPKREINTIEKMREKSSKEEIIPPKREKREERSQETPHFATSHTIRDLTNECA